MPHIVARYELCCRSRGAPTGSSECFSLVKIAFAVDGQLRTKLATILSVLPTFYRQLPYIIVGHCTGDRFYDLARAELGDRVIHSAVGTRFVFTGGL